MASYNVTNQGLLRYYKSRSVTTTTTAAAAIIIIITIIIISSSIISTIIILSLITPSITIYSYTYAWHFFVILSNNFSA